MSRISILKFLRFTALFGVCKASFIVNLELGEKECYHIRVHEQGSILAGSFDCWEESEEIMRPCHRFMAWVDEDPPSEEKRTHPTVWESNGEWDFHLEVRSSQRYRLCFLAMSKENEQASARRTTVVEEEEEEGDDEEGEDYFTMVGFNVRVHDMTRTLADEELGPDALRAVSLQTSAMYVEDQWGIMHDHFSYMRFREAEHKRISDQINERVMGWTILECLLVVIMAIGQVWYWKSFFEQRRFL